MKRRNILKTAVLTILSTIGFRQASRAVQSQKIEEKIEKDALIELKRIRAGVNALKLDLLRIGYYDKEFGLGVRAAINYINNYKIKESTYEVKDGVSVLLDALRRFYKSKGKDEIEILPEFPAFHPGEDRI